MRKPGIQENDLINTTLSGLAQFPEVCFLVSGFLIELNPDWIVSRILPGEMGRSAYCARTAEVIQLGGSFIYEGV